ncbi:NAD(P)-dependent oxidoreductase [Alkalilacustris brevis]|uniref:NAD(P)-dependent oxidoreductase n=1 Tax=Alkalilacustris brevis TaxID=2026338 RepID=UPI001390570E|nr:2-hydroxyacid dehydrogenase [Alkalilacustris brevis]
MTGKTIAIIDPFHPRVIETIRARLVPGWSLAVTEGPDEQQRARALSRADAAFVMATPLPASLLEQAPSLRFIQKLGAGVDRINTAWCAANGVAVARLQAGNNIPVAEHTLLLMLAACRNLPRLDAQTRAGRWDKEAVRGENRHLGGKTIGLVGFGAIGRQVARLLSGFGVRIVYYDPVQASPEDEAALNAGLLPLDDLLARADVVSLHLPLLPETAGLLSRARLAAMKPGAILVNAARGGLVDEEALVEALREGRLFSAALDAFSTEPPVGNPLLALSNTVVTPHCAGATIDNFASVADRAVENYQRFLRGAPLPEGDIAVAPPAG